MENDVNSGLVYCRRPSVNNHVRSTFQNSIKNRKRSAATAAAAVTQPVASGMTTSQGNAANVTAAASRRSSVDGNHSDISVSNSPVLGRSYYPNCQRQQQNQTQNQMKSNQTNNNNHHSHHHQHNYHHQNHHRHNHQSETSSSKSTKSTASTSGSTSCAGMSCSDDGDSSTTTSGDPNLPYPGFPEIALKYLTQDARPRNWCLKLITNPYPF